MGEQGYDYLLTLPIEVRYIWGKPASPITILFCAIRYMPFVDITVFLLRKFRLAFTYEMNLDLYKDEFLSKPSPSLCRVLYGFNTCELSTEGNVAFLCHPPKIPS